MKIVLKWIALIFIGLVILGLIFGKDSTEPNKNPSKQHESQSHEIAAVTPPENHLVDTTIATNSVQTDDFIETASSSDKDTYTETTNLTNQQKNAIRSAKEYLSFSGFSREGLIRQLSSSYGNGYEIADVTIAVDNLDVDWNEQAVRSARQYLDMSGFSCNGLIEQLSSDAGDKYTNSEATYGAQQAGACS